jgi:putative PIN family toxin of toxin-antitoxin system
MAAEPVVAAVVLDTNVVLDLLLFDDPAIQALKQALAEGRLRWLATPAMREEFERVLGYPRIVRQLVQRGVEAPQMLAAFDARASLTEAASRAPCVCADPDDQGFIDLAIARGATLWSKDQAVLCLARKAAALGACVTAPGRKPAL